MNYWKSEDGSKTLTTEAEARCRDRCDGGSKTLTTEAEARCRDRCDGDGDDHGGDHQGSSAGNRSGVPENSICVTGIIQLL